MKPLEKWIFKKNAKTLDVTADEFILRNVFKFSYFYGGNEELYLRKKRRKKAKPGKDGRL
jgi:hypothetical protein